jgi:hypothetical protein
VNYILQFLFFVNLMLKEGLFVVLWKGFYLFFWGVGHRCTFGPGGFSFYTISTLVGNFVPAVLER